MLYVEKTCERCGTLFQVATHYAKRKRFCTLACGARAAAARYREEHPETTREAVARWREANRPRHRQLANASYVRNREAAKARMRAYHKKRVEEDPVGMREAARLRYEKLRYSQPWRKLLANARHRAAVKNLPFDLTVEWITSRWTGRCEYCDVQFDVLGHKAFAPSIDRVDPTRGYTQDNCRLVIWAVNMLKSQFSDDEVALIARAIVNHTTPAENPL